MLKCCVESHIAVYCDPPIKCNLSFVGLLSISSCMPYTLHPFTHFSQYNLRSIATSFEHQPLCMCSSMCDKANFGAFWLSWTLVFHNVNFHHFNFTYNIYISVLDTFNNGKLVLIQPIHCVLAIETCGEKIAKWIILVVNKRFVVAIFGQLTTETLLSKSKMICLNIFLAMGCNGQVATNDCNGQVFF
jgi:hypothetical protein